VRKDAVQVRWNLFQRKVVILVAVSTPRHVKMLPFLLLGSKLGRRMTAAQKKWPEAES
jgi:hypothetical protein